MRSTEKILRKTGVVLISALILLLVSYLIIYANTQRRINTYYTFNDKKLMIDTDSVSIEKGKHLYQIRGCQDCHGKNLEGSIFMDDELLMKVTAPNLTKGIGGLAEDFKVEDWVRVIRHGVDKKGKSLWMMPSKELFELTDEDLADIIAFCTTQKNVDNSQEQLHSIGPIGRILMILDEVTVLPAEKINHNAIPKVNIQKNKSAKYGQYLAIGCQGCHRPTMQGGGPLAPGFPPVPDITSHGNLGNWKVEEFLNTLKTGKTPEGRLLDNNFMPWESMAHFSQMELESIYIYLNSLPTEKLITQN